jgi:uridine phosphorylase
MMPVAPEYRAAWDPVDADGRVYPLQCRPEDLADVVLLPGDPQRVQLLSSRWDEAREVASYRAHVVHSGSMGGHRIAAVSLGGGNTSAANVVEALARLGARTLLRIGSCGSINPDVRLGDLIIPTAVVRLDGASQTYVTPEYPALAHFEAVLALVQAAEELGHRYHVGITASPDGWYVTQGRPGHRGYWPSWAGDLIPDLQQAGVIGIDAESAGVYTLSSLYGLRAASVCAVYADRVRDTFATTGMDACIETATRAAQILRRLDAEKSILEVSGPAPDVQR